MNPGWFLVVAGALLLVAGGAWLLWPSLASWGVLELRAGPVQIGLLVGLSLFLSIGGTILLNLIARLGR